MLQSRSLQPEPADVAAVRALMPEAPVVALVLGSGLGAIAGAFDERAELSYDALPGMQGPTHVLGHGGRLVAGRVAGVPALAFQGRLHTYQGVSAYEAAYPARLAAALGARVLVCTNAAGGLSPQLAAGDLMLISDHVNLLGDNPLRAWPGPEGGVPFVPMGDAYDPQLRALAREVAAERSTPLVEGVYAAVSGPSYETPAEVRALRTLGADAVGMSTVPEVIAARALGMRVLGVSLVTNAAGGSDLSHDEVLAVGRAAEARLADLLVGVVGRMSAG